MINRILNILLSGQIPVRTGNGESGRFSGGPFSIGQEFGDDGLVGGQALGLFQLLEHGTSVGKVRGLIGPEFLHFSEHGMVAVQDGFVGGEQLVVERRNAFDVIAPGGGTRPTRSSQGLCFERRVLRLHLNPGLQDHRKDVGPMPSSGVDAETFLNMVFCRGASPAWCLILQKPLRIFCFGCKRALERGG